MRIWVQKSASMQMRTSPLKFGDFAEKSVLNSVSNLSTKDRPAAHPAPERLPAGSCSKGAVGGRGLAVGREQAQEARELMEARPEEARQRAELPVEVDAVHRGRTHRNRVERNRHQHGNSALDQNTHNYP